AAIDAAVASNREAAESRLAEARAEVTALTKAVRDELGAAVQTDRDTLDSLIKSDKVALETRIKNEIGSIESRIANEGVSMQARIFDDFSRRLAEYGSVVEARFEKLEAAGSELGALDQGLRASMDQAVRKIESDFASYDASLEERRTRFEEAFLVEAGKLRASMKALEQELESLKARAYDNVSEKLKVFEDDFAADLRARGEQIDARLASWRADMDGTLAELAAKAASDRAQAERAATEEARAKSAETQARLQEQLDTMRARVQAIQDGIQAQGGMASESLAALKDTVLKDAADARSTAQAYVEGEIARFQLEAGSRLKAVERETDARIAALSAAVSEEEGRVRETREAVAEAAESFRARFASAVAEAEAKARSELQAFSASTAALLGDARRDYETQRDGYMASAQSERDRLAKELSGLADRGSELRSDISARIAQALEGFARGHEAMMADLDRKRRDAQAEADLRLREYKDSVQDLGLKIESARTQALGKVDAEAARVAQSLAELDKEQKAFISQSKVFEKTDELREALSTGIETMKADLARLEGRKAELAEIEAQLGRVKRLEDEVNQKVTRFLAEKRRIDALEADFDKLSTVSASVDKRLEEVTNQADALTDAQAGIRRV
ncbi:MAG: hypothetical protein Q8M76_07785, partial [Spirochaetaceae bacterium]|nr:hypothetical protein [Spirochaetaceae bacterium]